MSILNSKRMFHYFSFTSSFNTPNNYFFFYSWVAEKEAYLNTKEAINSVSEAQTQLTLLEAYEKEKVSVAQTNVSHLKALGADIRAQKYYPCL
jgi:hypothetical protein